MFGAVKKERRRFVLALLLRGGTVGEGRGNWYSRGAEQDDGLSPRRAGDSSLPLTGLRAGWVESQGLLTDAWVSWGGWQSTADSQPLSRIGP